MMKKVLSIILAAALVFSILPTIAFAAEGETDAGITLTYNVSRDFGAWNATAPKFSEFTYEQNKGMWEYYGNSKSYVYRLIKESTYEN